MNDILLEMKNISKSFPGVRALDDVSLKVRRGTVHALMGENGAGKSTLMKILFGEETLEDGKIYSGFIMPTAEKFFSRVKKSNSEIQRMRSKTVLPWCIRS